MAQRVVGFHLWFAYQPESETFLLRVTYTPVGEDQFGQQAPINAYSNAFGYYAHGLSESVRRKVERLTDYVVNTALPTPDLEIDGVLVRGSATVSFYEVMPETLGASVRVVYRSTDNAAHQADIRLDAHQISEATQRLVANLATALEQLAWDDLRRRLGMESTTSGSMKKKVLISYRAGREKFAEAVAVRLGREGFRPWFDRWDVMAGDSLPREIGEGFSGVRAVIIILTADYPSGRWAREELETAITKRVQDGIRVIPVLFEDCVVPELLKPLVYVDCRDHRDDAFEEQFKSIIDALNEIELNPYR